MPSSAMICHSNYFVTINTVGVCFTLLVFNLYVKNSKTKQNKKETTIFPFFQLWCWWVRVGKYTFLDGNWAIKVITTWTSWKKDDNWWLNAKIVSLICEVLLNTFTETDLCWAVFVFCGCSEISSAGLWAHMSSFSVD